MRLAVSSIAWSKEEEPAVAKRLQDLGVTAVEVVPGSVAEDLTTAAPEQLNEYKRFWADHGVEIVAMQALLFGHPELTVFENKATQTRTTDYLSRIMETGAKLGAKAFVFGSPKNRLVGNLSPAEIEEAAEQFVRAVAGSAERLGVAFCLEPVPTDYGADWLTTTLAAAECVGKQDRAGLRLNLDTGCLTITGDDPTTVIPKTLPVTGHVHLSEPNLAPLGAGGTNHEVIAANLQSAGYDGVVSIEMKASESENLEQVSRAIEFVKKTYPIN